MRFKFSNGGWEGVGECRLWDVVGLALSLKELEARDACLRILTHRIRERQPESNVQSRRPALNIRSSHPKSQSRPSSPDVIFPLNS